MKGVRNGEVGNFLAIAEYPELGFAAQDFASANQTRLSRLIGEAVIFDYFFFIKGQRNRALLLGMYLSPELDG